MLFVPYKLDINLYRIPFLTALVCLACVLTFSNQLSSNSIYAERIQSYCAEPLDPNLQAILDAANEGSGPQGCAYSMLTIRNAQDRDAKIAELAKAVSKLSFYSDKDADFAYKTAKLASGYADFDLTVPQQLTDNLQYTPGQWNFARMLTSSFAHADIEHLLGNLFFFFVFAASVESVVGYFYFALAIVLMAVASSLAYSMSVVATQALPTIGLSGVVMGMMAMITTLMPKVRVWCLFWFLFFVRRFTLPLTVIALWYIGWNVYDYLNDDGSSRINYMAHIGGAASGVLLGLLFKVVHRERHAAMAVEMEH